MPRPERKSSRPSALSAIPSRKAPVTSRDQRLAGKEGHQGVDGQRLDQDGLCSPPMNRSSSLSHLPASTIKQWEALFRPYEAEDPSNPSGFWDPEKRDCSF